MVASAHEGQLPILISCTLDGWQAMAAVQADYNAALTAGPIHTYTYAYCATQRTGMMMMYVETDD